MKPLFKSLTFQEIKLILTDVAHEAFVKWMRGQTCGVNEDNVPVVYAWDFERWVRSSLINKSPQKEQGADWD